VIYQNGRAVRESESTSKTRQRYEVAPRVKIMMYLAMHPNDWISTEFMQDLFGPIVGLRTCLEQAMDAGLLVKKNATEFGGSGRERRWGLSPMMKEMVRTYQIGSYLLRGTGFVDDQVKLQLSGKELSIDVSDLDLVVEELNKYRAMRDANTLR